MKEKKLRIIATGRIVEGRIFKRNRRIIPVYLICCAVILLSLILHLGRAFEYMTPAPSGLGKYEMTSGEVYSQRIEAGAMRLSSLWIKFSTYERVNQGEVSVVFYKNGEELRRWTINASELVDDKYREFPFGRQIRIRQEDECRFTVQGTFSEDSQLGLWKAVIPESEREEEGRFCFRMSLGDPEMAARAVLPVLLVSTVLFAVAIVSIDIRRVGIAGMILAAICILVLTEVITVDLFQKIRRDVPLYSFAEKSVRASLEPGENLEEKIEIRRGDFTNLRFSVSDTDDRSLDIRVRLENEDTGVVCYDRLIPGNEFISGGPAGRIIQISADDTEAPGLFQRGSYKVRITNEDPEKKLFLSVVEDEDKVNAEEKEEAEANRHLDFAVIRTSGIGYGVAFFVIFILCAYMIAVASLLTGPGFSMRRLFVFSAVPLSVIYLVLFSPWTIPDNKDHFWAAYRISGMILREEGADEWKMRADDALFYDGHQSPENPGTGNIGEMFWNVCLQARDESRVSTEPSDKMRCYSILNYLPQTVGLTIGRLLGLGTVLTMTLARILMLAVYIAACAHAVQITPLGKAVFAAVPLLPMSLMLSGSFSYDAMVLVSTLCFTASVLRAREESESLFALAECVAWAVVLGGVKGGAFLIFLPLALMLLPQSLQSSQRLRAGNNLLRPGIVIAAGALSALFFDVLLAPDGLYQLGEEGTSTMRASFALIHPLKFLCLLASTYLNSADELILNMGGTRLAWLEATIPAAVIGALLVIIAVQSVFEKDRIRLRGRDRGLFLWVLAMEIVFTPIMLLSWTEYGDDRIRGLQGRYYLPVFLMLVFVFTKYTLHEQADQSGSLVSGSTELVESENNNNTGSDPGLVVRKCVGWFCGLSCLCVYYLMRLYLVR